MASRSPTEERGNKHRGEALELARGVPEELGRPAQRVGQLRPPARVPCLVCPANGVAGACNGVNVQQVAVPRQQRNQLGAA